MITDTEIKLYEHSKSSQNVDSVNYKELIKTIKQYVNCLLNCMASSDILSIRVELNAIIKNGKITNCVANIRASNYCYRTHCIHRNPNDFWITALSYTPKLTNQAETVSIAFLNDLPCDVDEFNKIKVLIVGFG